jgi:hypothetical protein
MTKESSPMIKTHTGNIIEMVGVRHVGDLFMFETPYEEVWSFELVAQSDTLKRPIVVSRIGYKRVSV